MWSLYILMAALTAGILIKVVNPLLGRGRLKHDDSLTPGDTRLFYTLSLFLPVASISLYLCLGEPELEGHPALLTQYQDMHQRHLSLLSIKPFKTLVEKDPHNAGALLSLALVNRRLQNYDQAVSFYKLALKEAEKRNDIQLRPIAVALAETQVEGNRGIVGEDAVETFNYVLGLHPENPFARYYLALRKSQQGKDEEALAEWTALLEGGYPEIFWKSRVRDKIAETRKRLGK